MLLFAVGIALLLVSSGALAAALRPALPGLLLATYLIAVAQVVLLTEVLSPFGAVGQWGYVTGQLVFLALALVVWAERGRPRPALPRVAYRAALRAHPILAVLALLVAFAFAYEVFLAVAMPPTTWDAMTYHLPRAVGWLQEGALEYLDAHTTRQNVNPPNAEIQILYTFAFLGRETFVAAPQLLAQIVIVVAIYGIARRLGYDRAPSAFAALLYPTLSQVALQATSTQNDLAAAAPIAAAAYLVLGRRDAELPLAGLAVGLAIGTKLSVLFALPILGLLSIITLRREQLVKALAWSAASFAVVGAWTYVLNIAHSGSPLGDSPEIEAFAPEITAPGTFSTAARITYGFADLSGFDVDPILLDRFRVVGETLFDASGIDPEPEESTALPFRYTPNTLASEDVSFFGPLGLFLLLPLSATFIVAWVLRRVPHEHGVLALGLPLFIVAVALSYRYTPWAGRFMVLPVALLMPLAAAIYTRRLWMGLVIIVGAATLSVVHLENVGKEPRTSPWSLPRIDALTVKRVELRPVFEAVEQRVPVTARLGILLGPDSWSYPLYGERLERRLVQVRPDAPFRDAESLGLRWILVDDAHQLAATPGWRRTSFSPGWLLFSR